MAADGSFRKTLRAAVAELVTDGYHDVAQLAMWLQRLRHAARMAVPDDQRVETAIGAALRKAFDHALKPNQLRKTQGITGFGIEQIKPALRQELDRRILASANLIKLNRDRRIEETLQRFSGWATSIPLGGSKVTDRRDVAAEIGKPVNHAHFEQRRVEIDQGHKLVAAVNDVIAAQAGAIAAVWRSHGRHDHSYDARPAHLARDGKVFVIRGNWALEKGLMKRGGAKYTDEVEMVGELPFCRCFYVYLHGLRELPATMVTDKGRATLVQAA